MLCVLQITVNAVWAKTSYLQYILWLMDDDYSQLSADQIANVDVDKNSWRKLAAACTVVNW